MQFSLFSDYSMRLLMFLAARPGEAATIRQIAQKYDISRPHLMKVANELAKSGIIQALRGRTGGLKLAVEPEQINVGSVLRGTERHLALVQCFDETSNQCILLPGCRLKSVLAEAEEGFYEILDRYTLADLMKSSAVRNVFSKAAATD